MKPRTTNQRGAGSTSARKLTCPKCLRMAALSALYDLKDGAGRRIGSARTCRYCDHETGHRHGQRFGR